MRDSIQSEKNQLKNMLVRKSPQNFASDLLADLEKPIQYLKYNLSFLNHAFIEIYPILKPGEISKEKIIATEQNSVINKSDFDYLCSEVPIAIDQAIKGLDEILDIQTKLINFISNNI